MERRDTLNTIVHNEHRPAQHTANITRILFEIYAYRLLRALEDSYKTGYAGEFLSPILNIS